MVGPQWRKAKSCITFCMFCVLFNAVSKRKYNKIVINYYCNLVILSSAETAVATVTKFILF